MLQSCLKIVVLGIACTAWQVLGTSVQADEFRTWTDVTGAFKIEATLLGVQNDVVMLQSSAGKRIQVPLAKLSEKDRGYLEAKAGANPFRVVDETAAGGSVPASGSLPSGSAAAVSASTAPRELRVDFQAVPAAAPIIGDWQVKPDVATTMTPTFKPLDLPNSKIEHEKVTGIVTHPGAKRLLVSYSPDDIRNRDRNRFTRLVLIDLESGKVLGNASGEGRWKAMAIHDDGETLVISNLTEGVAQGQLGTVRVSGSKIAALDIWRPYETLAKPDKEKDVTFAEFANDGKLVTCSQGGNLVIWDFATRRPLARFDYHGACQPSLSPNRAQIGISGGDLVGFYDLETNEFSGVKSAPQMNYWLKSAFSPSGRRFAAATLGKLMVWEVESGAVLFDGAFHGIPMGAPLQYPDENFVLLSSEYLVELEHKIKLWQFIGKSHSTRYGSTPVFAVNHGGSLRLFPSPLPNAEITKMLDAALTQPDLFVVREGVEMGIDVSQVPAAYRAEVEQALQEQIEKLGCRFSTAAPVVLKASIQGPKAEAVSYTFGGNFVLQQYTSVLEVQYQGATLWSGNATNTPGVISGRSRESLQQQIDEAGKKPNLQFFANAGVPRFIQKPLGKNTNGRAPQTLGVSQVTPNGLRTL